MRPYYAVYLVQIFWILNTDIKLNFVTVMDIIKIVPCVTEIAVMLTTVQMKNWSKDTIFEQKKMSCLTYCNLTAIRNCHKDPKHFTNSRFLGKEWENLQLNKHKMGHSAPNSPLAPRLHS